MPPNPLTNAHGFAMRSMSLRDMQIPKSEKNNYWPPPLPNPGNAHVYCSRCTSKLQESAVTKANTFHDKQSTVNAYSAEYSRC